MELLYFGPQTAEGYERCMLPRSSCVCLSHHMFNDFVNKGMKSIGQRSNTKMRRQRYVHEEPACYADILIFR